MNSRDMKWLFSSKSPASAWAVLCYVGNSGESTLESALAKLFAAYTKAQDKPAFVHAWESRVSSDKQRGANSDISKGVNLVLAHGGAKSLAWLPEDVLQWAREHDVIAHIDRPASPPASVTPDLSAVAAHPLMPAYVTLLMGTAVVVLLGYVIVDGLNRWFGIPAPIGLLVAVALGAFALQWLVRTQFAKKATASGVASTAVATGSKSSRRFAWLGLGIVLVVLVAGVLLWSTGEDVSSPASSEQPSAVIIMTLTPSPTPTLSASVLPEATPTPPAVALSISRASSEDPALRGVVDGYVKDMYACARVLEQLRQISPAGLTPSTYVQLLQVPISGASTNLNVAWGNLVTAMSRSKMPAEVVSMYNESPDGGRYGVFHSTVVAACDLITIDLSRVFTEWANTPSTETPDFSSFDRVTAQLDAANNAVVFAAGDVGVLLGDLYRPDWVALKNAFYAVIRPTPMPTPVPTQVAVPPLVSAPVEPIPQVVIAPTPIVLPVAIVPTLPPQTIVIVPTLIPLPEPTPIVVGLVDIPCSGMQGVHYNGGALNPSSVTADMQLTWLDADNCRMYDVARGDAFLAHEAYCEAPDRCYVVVEMLDGAQRGRKLFVNGRYKYSPQ